MRCPAAVLVDRQLHALRFGLRHQRRAHVQIHHEGLLAQHVLAGVDGRFEDRHPLLWVRGDIHDLDVVACEQFAIIEIGSGLRIKFVAPPFHTRPVAAAQRRYMVTGILVGPQMHFRDSTAADQADRRTIVFGVARLIGQIGRRDLALGPGLAAAVAAVFRHGDSYWMSGRVRFCAALWKAVSTICWPTRHSAGASGPSISFPSSMQ